MENVQKKVKETYTTTNNSLTVWKLLQFQVKVLLTKSQVHSLWMKEKNKAKLLDKVLRSTNDLLSYL
jgi:hypothetical protein